MAKTKRYASVSQMLKDNAPDESFREEFGKYVSQRRIVKHLLAMRAVKDVSQKEIADRLNCSQSRISKLENGVDDDLRLGDLRGYLSALGLKLGLVVADRDWTAVDEIKHHAFSIKKLMDRLAHFANLDDKIARGVSDFFGEAFLNLVSMIQDSASKLPPRPEGETPYIQIELFEGVLPNMTVEDDTEVTGEEGHVVVGE